MASGRCGLLLSLVLALFFGAGETRRVDCTKFVFAPVCRGVAAKRAEGLPDTSGTALEDYGLDLSSDDASSFNDNEQSAGQEQPSNWPEQRLALLRQLIPAFAALEQEKKETARLGKPAGTYDDAFTEDLKTLIRRVLLSRKF